jgi:hypothetical protein
MENGCHQSQFVFSCKLGIRCHSPEVCHTWGKAEVIASVVSEDIQGKRNYLLSHSQHTGAGRRSQPPAQLIYRNEANLWLRSVFPACAGMKCSTENGLIQVYFTIPDLYIVSTIRMGAYPGLVLNWCPLTTKVRQRH